MAGSDRKECKDRTERTERSALGFCHCRFMSRGDSGMSPDCQSLNPGFKNGVGDAQTRDPTVGAASHSVSRSEVEQGAGASAQAGVPAHQSQSDLVESTVTVLRCDLQSR